MKKQIKDISEIQSLELDIFLHLKEFFEQNGIRYFTYAGTTIGSVRHGGFIPWDDDIDLIIPREDYNRLLSISDGKLIGGYIEIKKPGDKNYIYPYAKACNINTVIYERNISDKKYATGIFVDLFPLDNIYNSKLLNSALFLRTALLQSALESASNQVNLSEKGSAKYIIKQITRAIQKPFAKAAGVEKITKRLDDIGTSLLKVSSEKAGDIYYALVFNKEWFASADEGKFEGYGVNNPSGYHECLTSMYGDYMTVPPESEREAHCFEAWIDTKDTTDNG